MGEDKRAVGLLVEDLVQRRQQCFRLLVDMIGQTIGQFQRGALQRRVPRVVLRPLRRGPGERQKVGDHGQYRHVLLREQRREIAVAGVGQQREEVLLLEIEVMRNVKLEVATSDAARRANPGSRAASGG